MMQNFNLHIFNTGQLGGSISSIHMNRAQAARLIRQNIINNCRSHLGRPYNVTPFIDKASNIVGHKIPYYLANDISFVEFLRLSGANYWFREYDRYMKNGKELQPSKDDRIFLEELNKPKQFINIFNKKEYSKGARIAILVEQNGVNRDVLKGFSYSPNYSEDSQEGGYVKHRLSNITLKSN